MNVIVLWVYMFVCLFCVFRKHSYVQLCVELQGSIPCPAPPAAASSDWVQIGRQGLLDLPALYDRGWRLSAAPPAQPGPGGDLWRRHRGDISGLSLSKTRMERHRAPGAGQVRQEGLCWRYGWPTILVSRNMLNPSSNQLWPSIILWGADVLIDSFSPTT